jgi:hypothetical protein
MDPVASLPVLFLEDPPPEPRNAELFGRLVSLDDPESLAQFRSAGGCVFPVVTSSPPHLHREDEALMVGQAATPARPAASRVPLVSVCSRFNIVAAALGDRVYFFDLVAQQWLEQLSLHSREAQRNITALQFRRGGSPNDLLVASDRGLCCWTVRWQEKQAEMRSFAESTSRGSSVLAMDCSPDGLFVATVRSGIVHVWDVNRGEALTFRGNFGPSVSFSSDGAHLVCGHASSGLIRVWRTLDWSEQQWASPRKLPVRFAPTNFVGVSGFAMYSLGGKHFSRVAIADRHNRGDELDMYEGSFALPFPAKQMVFSPCGRRLAIAFECSAPLIGIVDSGNATNMFVLGYVRGSQECEQVESMEFRRGSVGGGALLCVVWRNATISFVEFLF